MRFRMLQNTLQWTLSFPNFTWCSALFEKCTLRFGPKDFVLFRKIDLYIGDSISWKTQPNCFEFSNKSRRSFSNTFLRLSAGLTVSLSVHEDALFTEFCIPIVFCNLDIRDANNHMMYSYKFL